MLAQGLPCRKGRQLAIDITLRSVLTGDGKPRPRAAGEDGVVAEGARQDKADTYPELVTARRCELIVLAIETGGRWSTEAASFIEELATARARDAPARLLPSARRTWRRRWARMLAVACGTAFAESLTAPAGSLGAAAQDGHAPLLETAMAGLARG